MKIAVLLYGHLRDFEKCADSLNEHLLSRYDSDVFIHTWDERDHNSKCWHEQRFEATHVGEEMVEVIKSKYHPQGLIVEHQEKYKDEKLVELSGLRGIKMSTAIPHFMFYSMNKANQLRIDFEKKKGVSYDYVFVTRPDIRLKKEFDLEYYLHEIDVLGLDQNACRLYAPFEDMSLGATFIARSNDLFFFAKPSVIDRYIEANRVLTDEDFCQYGITILTILTAKEIRAGIMPIPLTYSMNSDWDYSSIRVQARTKSHPHKRWRTIVFGIGAILLYPIFRLQKKYRLLSFYEFQKEIAQ